MSKVRWGVLSTSHFSNNTVLPAMQKGEYCSIQAIASRRLESARAVAAQLNIPKAYGSYEELLADPEIEAVYIPLPNHLHVPWSIKALQAGKHVLCEKPIALDAAQAQELLQEAARHPGLKVMEAFMYRHHPQWHKVLEIIHNGDIGEIQTIHSFFSYYNTDLTNIRNQEGVGGGGLLDIGCYNISISRLCYGQEPRRIMGWLENDPQFKVDRLASGILEFEGGTATFTCTTQAASFQRAQVFGTRGWIEVELPFNPIPEQPARIQVKRGEQLEQMAFELCNHYTIQGDLFSRAVLDNTPVPTPLEDAHANMKVIDAVFASARGGVWVNL
jgi:predicted dehydrogenase